MAGTLFCWPQTTCDWKQFSRKSGTVSKYYVPFIFEVNLDFQQNNMSNRPWNCIWHKASSFYQRCIFETKSKYILINACSFCQRCISFLELKYPPRYQPRRVAIPVLLSPSSTCFLIVYFKTFWLDLQILYVSTFSCIEPPNKSFFCDGKKLNFQ